MPKVSNHRMRIDGEVVIVDIYYGKKDGFSAKGFPDHVLKITGAKSVTSGFTTEHELIRKMDQTVKDYHDQTTVKRKVIVFQLFASTNIRMNKCGVDSWSGTRPGISENVVGSDVTNGDYGIGFNFDVLLETSRNGKLVYNEIKENGTLGYSRDFGWNNYTTIDWSEEREQAFRNLGEAMYQLMVKISNALGDEKKAIAFIESKMKLLQ